MNRERDKQMKKKGKKEDIKKKLIINYVNRKEIFKSIEEMGTERKKKNSSALSLYH